MESYRDKDILCGRGGKVNRHSGNKIYRRLIDDKRGLYRSMLRTDQKALLVNSILMALQQEGMRFLRFDEESELWYEIDHDEAFMKTSQAFREPDRKWLASVAAAAAAASSSEATAPRCQTPKAGDRAESAVQNDASDEEQSSSETVERGPMTALEDAAAVQDAILSGTPVPRGHVAYSPHPPPSILTPAGGHQGITLLRQSAFPAPATNTSDIPRPTPVHSMDINTSLLAPAQEGLLLLNSNRNGHQPKAPSLVTPSTISNSQQRPQLPRQNTADIMQFMKAIAPEAQVVAPGVEQLPFGRAISGGGGGMPANTTANSQLPLQLSGLPFLAFLPSISIGVSPDHPAWPSIALGNTLRCTSIGRDWNGLSPNTSLGLNFSLALDPNFSISLDPFTGASTTTTDGRSRAEHADLHTFDSQRQAQQQAQPHWLYGSFSGNAALAEALSRPQQQAQQAPQNLSRHAAAAPIPAAVSTQNPTATTAAQMSMYLSGLMRHNTTDSLQHLWASLPPVTTSSSSDISFAAADVTQE